MVPRPSTPSRWTPPGSREGREAGSGSWRSGQTCLPVGIRLDRATEYRLHDGDPLLQEDAAKDGGIIPSRRQHLLGARPRREMDLPKHGPQRRSVDLLEFLSVPFRAVNKHAGALHVNGVRQLVHQRP